STFGAEPLDHGGVVGRAPAMLPPVVPGSEQHPRAAARGLVVGAQGVLQGDGHPRQLTEGAAAATLFVEAARRRERRLLGDVTEGVQIRAFTNRAETLVGDLDGGHGAASHALRELGHRQGEQGLGHVSSTKAGTRKPSGVLRGASRRATSVGRPGRASSGRRGAELTATWVGGGTALVSSSSSFLT